MPLLTLIKVFCWYWREPWEIFQKLEGLFLLTKMNLYVFWSMFIIKNKFWSVFTFPIFLFFLISNKTFIEKSWTSCSRWWTLWTMKQIQEDQELKEMETKKSSTAVQFIHPQIRAQRNRVQKSKHFKCSKVLALPSKMRALCSC